MAKFYGMIGFAKSVELSPGVYEEMIEERPYYGDALQELRRLKEDERVNPNVTIGNRISVLSDAYATHHIFDIRYVVWSGARWTVGTAEVKPPRLVLSLSTVYNGPTPEDNPPIPDPDPDPDLIPDPDPDPDPKPDPDPDPIPDPDPDLDPGYIWSGTLTDHEGNVSGPKG